MKMSKSNYEKFKSWFDYTVEYANDDIIEYIMACLVTASEVALKNVRKAKKHDERKRKH